MDKRKSGQGNNDGMSNYRQFIDVTGARWSYESNEKPCTTYDQKFFFEMSEEGAHTHSITGCDKETRPINMSLMFIIKAKPSQEQQNAN